jgi:diketogulonate reductase-like aldo/keto reductase
MIDPSRIPQRTLYTGACIPAIGLGTFASDHVSHQQVAKAVFGAAEVGFRHFDCAAVYGNEALIGESLRKVMANGVKREDLWITSKLWNNNHAEEDVIPSFKKSLGDLKLDYLDLYLIHWPFPNHHAVGVDVTSRDHYAKPYIHQHYMKTWRQLEKLVDMGLVRHIGTSNMTVPKLNLLLADARVKPAVNEMEMHPQFQQPEFFKFVKDNDMEVIAYCPIGSPNRPERDRTPEDTNLLEDPVIVRISQRLGVHPATVCIKWAIQRGQIPIPMSVNPKNYLANLQAAITEPLTEQDMTDIASIDRDCRLIKGQVFLWKEHQNWRDLWDEDGVIVQ